MVAGNVGNDTQGKFSNEGHVVYNMESIKITAFWEMMSFSFVHRANISEGPVARVCHDTKVKVEVSGVCET